MTLQVNIMSYGYAHLAAQAIESILSQTRKPDKILVVDDGKHDGLDKIAERYPVEILIRENNLGIVENFQDVLMNKTHTDKVLFLGADNWLHPLTLETLLNKSEDIVSYDITLVGTEVDKFKEKIRTEYKDGYYIWKFEKGNIESGNYIHGSSLYDVKKAKESGGYMSSGGQHTEEDWMLFRGMLRNGATHKHIQEPFLYYRRHTANFNKI